MTTQTTQPNIFKPLSWQSQSRVDGVEVLIGLGLTGRQARVYLALLRCGGAKAKLIAQRSVVERQEVYSLLENLSELGLVKRSLCVPTSYIATPLAEGVKLLLQQKASQMTVLRQQSDWLIERYRELEVLPKLAVRKADYGTVYEADRGKKYLKAIGDCQKSIVAVVSWRRFKQFCLYYEGQFLGALKRGVVVRFVTEKPLNHRLPKWVKAALAKYPNFEVKTVLVAPEAGVAVFDAVEVAVAFEPQSSIKRGPDLWSAHGGLVAACRGYFDAKWAE